MRILALVPGGISDQILFFPTLQDLQEKYPKAKIDVIVEPRAKPAYRVYPLVHEVLIFDYRDRNGLADYLNLLGIIRDREYEVVISTGQKWAIGLLLWLNGIPTRIGYKTTTSWFFDHTVPLKPEKYQAEQYHDLLQCLGIKTPCPPLKVILPKEDIDWAEREQKRLDIQDAGYILLHDNPSISYPVAQWQQIVGDIQSKQPNLPIFLLQAADKSQWVEKMQESCSELKLIKPGDVGKLAAIIAGANLMLCSNSAILHLSVAVGTYTLALLGSTEAAKCLPPNQDRYFSIQSSTDNLADIPPQTILKQMWRG